MYICVILTKSPYTRSNDDRMHLGAQIGVLLLLLGMNRCHQLRPVLLRLPAQSCSGARRPVPIVVRPC